MEITVDYRHIDDSFGEILREGKRLEIIDAKLEKKVTE